MLHPLHVVGGRLFAGAHRHTQ